MRCSRSRDPVLLTGRVGGGGGATKKRGWVGVGLAMLRKGWGGHNIMLR